MPVVGRCRRNRKTGRGDVDGAIAAVDLSTTLAQLRFQVPEHAQLGSIYYQLT